MLGATIFFSTAALFWAMTHLILAGLFRRHFERLEHLRHEPGRSVTVAVLMSIRGCDPSLRKGLIGILQQEGEGYQYEVHLVIDHRSDPAWQVAHQVKAEFDGADRLRIHALQEPQETCGLKCSALIEGLRFISPETEYLLLMDSDVVPHRFWIGDLIGPMEGDATIGLVLGNQWFEPPAEASWGALLRSVWQAGSLVPTVYLGNPWAGTIGMCMTDIREGKFVEAWQNSIVDDGPLKELVHRRGKRVVFAPSLIMINTEQCSVDYTLRWMTRMLTWSRLHERTYFLTVLHAVAINVAMIGLVGLLVAAVVLGDSGAVMFGGLALIGSGVLSVASYQLSRNVAKASAARSGCSLASLTWGRKVKILLVVPWAQFVYGAAALRSCFTKRICWREITYEIKSKDQVRLVAYAPMSPSSTSSASDESL